MADFVLSIAHPDLMTLVDHLPAAHKPWWQTFILVGAPIITAATSIITVGVLIANRKLTKEVSNINYTLAAEQSNTAKENKKIAQNKLKMEIYKQLSDLYVSYLDEYHNLTINFDERRFSREHDIRDKDEDEKIVFVIRDMSERTS